MANISSDMERAAPGPSRDNKERVQLLLTGNQSSTEKAQTLIGLLEEGFLQARARQLDSDDDETEDDDDEVDYMEDDGDASLQAQNNPPRETPSPTKGDKPTSSASSPVDQSDSDPFEYQVPDQVLLAGTSSPLGFASRRRARRESRGSSDSSRACLHSHRTVATVYPVSTLDPTLFDPQMSRTSFRFSAPVPPKVFAAAALGAAVSRTHGNMTHPRAPLRPTVFLGRARASALRLTRRLVRYLEATDDEEDQHSDADRDLAFGDFHEDPNARSIQAAAQQADGSGYIPPPLATPSGNIKTAVRSTRTSTKPTSEFEILLRTKIFKPAVELTTSMPEPFWTDLDAGPYCFLFPIPPETPLSPRSLLPLGQFVAERDKNIREALKEIELGVGVSASGFGVDVNATGLLQLLKPYQWINTWRSLPREVHVRGDLLQAAESADSEDAKMERLHKIENELMSSVKYQFGESEYITVITFSNDVDSGAVALFKASSFGKNSTVTRLDLEARFQDMPKEICRILVKEGNPNRFELKRAGKTLTCRARGILPPLRPAVVAAEEGKEQWTDIGGGWRRALHIILHDDQNGYSELPMATPREGVIATVPQMLALLHLRYRVVDAVPSSPIFSFAPPLRSGKGGAGPSGYVRRGIKLLGPPSGAPHVGNEGTIAVLFSRESRWVREQLFWA